MTVRSKTFTSANQIFSHMTCRCQEKNGVGRKRRYAQYASDWAIFEDFKNISSTWNKISSPWNKIIKTTKSSSVCKTSTTKFDIFIQRYSILVWINSSWKCRALTLYMFCFFLMIKVTSKWDKSSIACITKTFIKTLEFARITRHITIVSHSQLCFDGQWYKSFK